MVPIITQRTISRRTVFTAGALGLFSLGATGCAPSKPTITLYQSKPEVIPYFRDLIAQFNETVDDFKVVHDATSSLSGSFARGNPPDAGCLNYNYEMARFQERGELSDLSGMLANINIAPGIQELVDQYPTYPGRTSVIPYSMMAAATFYNKDIFDAHGLDIPETYSELIDVCEKLTAAGVTPFYFTTADAWTISQGIADYSIGGSIDVADFFAQLRALGQDASDDSEVSFAKNFKEPLEKGLQLAQYTNKDATSRGYGDGNLAFANGEAAMYLQGPWAISEIMSINPDANIGIFPLPMTENPADRKVRVNLDLALWIPEKASHLEYSRQLLEYLLTPSIMDEYNAANNGFGVREDSPAVTDPRLQDLQKFVDEAAFYQGASVSIPRTIPFENYMQSIFSGGNLEETLKTLDGDWQRTARRQATNEQ